MDFRKRFAVPPDGKFKLADIDPAYKGEHESHQSAAPEIVRNIEALAHLQYKLYAEGRRSLQVLMRQEKTASFVIFLIASIRKGST
jgi:hypothetical protein